MQSTAVALDGTNEPDVLLQVDSFQRDAMAYVKPNHGTTTLSFIFNGGIIVAADSRASSGSYICKHLRPYSLQCFFCTNACTH